MIPGQAWTCSRFFIHLSWKFNLKDHNTFAPCKASFIKLVVIDFASWSMDHKGQWDLSHLHTYMNIDIRLLSAVAWQQKCHKQSCMSLEAVSDHEEQNLHVA